MNFQRMKKILRKNYKFEKSNETAITKNQSTTAMNETAYK